MRHAYLIMAHNEWEMLQLLVSCIDDERNDIYIHIDKKVAALPEIVAHRANLIFIEERIDVRWADVSIMQAEYALFRAATTSGSYAYYHLLSGSDMPLKSQDYIHDFCDAHLGKEFIGYTLKQVTPEVVRKVRVYHPFPKHFRGDSGVAELARRAIRAIAVRLQLWSGIRRNKDIDFKKGTQFVSVTEAFVKYLLQQEKWMLSTFHHTFCCDEIVMQTLCWNSPFKENLYNVDADDKGCMRAVGWRRVGYYRDWAAEDYDFLKGSPAFFARKFNSTDMNFVHRIAELSNPSE